MIQSNGLLTLIALSAGGEGSILHYVPFSYSLHYMHWVGHLHPFNGLAWGARV